MTLPSPPQPMHAARQRLTRWGAVALVAVAALQLLACSSTQMAGAPAAVEYAVDPYWPQPLPHQWQVGAVAGVAVDRRDHVWIVQRPSSLTDDEKAASFQPPRAVCCVPAPSVIEFDPAGKVVRSWGVTGTGFDFPKREHGIYVDAQDNVWIAGNHDQDHQVMKLSADGKFLLQIGKAGQTGGSNDTKLLGKPAHMEVDAAANELYVADGYGNRRVIVFDATTGAYKRHWGAYGSRPDDAKTTYDPAAAPSRQFGTPVHCVRLARDGLVYVCDRQNNRIQVFRKSGEFVREFFLEKQTVQIGSVWDMVLSNDPAQTYLYVADGGNNVVHVLQRATGAKVSAFGRNGRMAGQFHWVHNIAVDSKGNLFTAEVDTGKRLQRFVPK
jgi:DNA-binding beta-propeller fold protein YncE